MTECNHEAFTFSNCRKRQVRGNFAGDSISSNGGALFLREVDRRIGLTAKVARALGDRRQHGRFFTAKQAKPEFRRWSVSVFKRWRWDTKI